MLGGAQQIFLSVKKIAKLEQSFDVLRIDKKGPFKRLCRKSRLVQSFIGKRKVLEDVGVASARFQSVIKGLKSALIIPHPQKNDPQVVMIASLIRRKADRTAVILHGLFGTVFQEGDLPEIGQRTHGKRVGREHLNKAVKLQLCLVELVLPYQRQA